MDEVILIGGLGYGDEGKGSMVDYLARVRGSKLVVRFNGGAQAAHNVVTTDGRHHTFAQFGSGTLTKGVKTHLSRFMVVNPLSMMREEEHLQEIGVKDAFQRITIDEDALIVTPFHIATNRILEIGRGEKRHGSCGAGIGQTVENHLKYGDRVLFAKDLRHTWRMIEKLGFIQEENRASVRDAVSTIAEKTEAIENGLAWLEDSLAVNDVADAFRRFTGLVKIVKNDHLAKLLKQNAGAIFEGAQGVLLDRNYGFKPYVTKTNTTFANAHALLKEAGWQGKVSSLGLIRAYATRHGPGPFVTEDDDLSGRIQDVQNPANEWQGKFRIGWLDLPATRYGLVASESANLIGLTNLDRFSGTEKIRVCLSYEYEGDLSLLSPWFEWEPLGKDKARITALKKRVNNDGILAQLLFRCRPLEFREFPGWQKDISQTRNLKELPKETHEYLNFLQSQQGLNIPLSVVSVSPTAEGKISIN